MWAGATIAGPLDDVGYEKLRTAAGESLPRGHGIAIAQVESSIAVDHDGDDATPELKTWLPNLRARDLAGLPIEDRSGAPAARHSGHATAVARKIVGRQGMATASTLAVFSVSHWLGGGHLQLGSRLPPSAHPFRITNHSWAGAGRNLNVLRRTDWLTDRDEVVHVAGVRNAAGKPNLAFMASLANAIVVGRSDGLHSTGTPQLDDVIYPGGRSRPHLVAPQKTGSAAAPMVTSAVAVLLEAAQDPTLSDRQDPFTNRAGVKIFDAGRSEVVRAILMAAASRETLEDYAAAPERTGNGLDARFGAGQLDVYRAWHILQAGEQRGEPGLRGFDYEPALASGATVRYRLPKVDRSAMLAATLSWNLGFPAGERFDASASLAELVLVLCETGETGDRVVRASRARGDTTQTVWIALDPGMTYALDVIRRDSLTPVQDYALAWHLSAPEPD